METYLTTSQACAFLGVSYPTFQRMVKTYDIPVYVNPVDRRARLYRQSHLEGVTTLTPQIREEVPSWR